MDKICFSFTKEQCELLFTGISFYKQHVYGTVTFPYIEALTELQNVFFDSFYDASENSTAASESK